MRCRPIGRWRRGRSRSRGASRTWARRWASSGCATPRGAISTFPATRASCARSRRPPPAWTRLTRSTRKSPTSRASAASARTRSPWASPGRSRSTRTRSRSSTTSSRRRRRRSRRRASWSPPSRSTPGAACTRSPSGAGWWTRRTSRARGSCWPARARNERAGRVGSPHRSAPGVRVLALTAQAPIEHEPLRLERRPVPEPGPDEILVRVGACGVCRTDLHLVEGDLPLVRSPIVPGHQVVGRIERAGAGATRFEAGARVGLAWLRRPCGACAYCASGRENLCERAEFTGYYADGGFADYAVAPAAFAYRIPAAFSDADAAPLLCAGIIGYRALKRSETPPGGRLGIYGFGSSAHVTLQVARARGCEVFVCTREASHRELARRLGAAWAGDRSEEHTSELQSHSDLVCRLPLEKKKQCEA